MYIKKTKKKKQRMRKSQQHINLRMSSKTYTSVMNSSTHIKTPILSRIVTKPTKWQVHPAKVQGSMGGSSYPRGAWTRSFTEFLSGGANRSNYPPRLTGSFVRLLSWDIMWHYGRLFWANTDLVNGHVFILIPKILLNYDTNCEKIIS